MKKLVPVFAFSATLLGACSGSGDSRLSVSISGMPDDSLICSWFTPATVRERGDMTTVLVGGTRNGDKTEFDIDLPDGDHLYRVFLAPQSFRGDGPRQNMELFLLPGERPRIEAAYDAKSKAIEYTLEGSADQQRWREATRTVEPLQLRLDMLSATAMMISPDRRNPNDTVYLQIRHLGDSIRKIKTDYIVAHPADPVSGFFLTTLPNDAGFDSLYNRLDESVRQGPLKEWLDLQKELSDKLVASQQARETVKTGAVAPDFTLPDADGKEFVLSSLYGQGKYVVLDFWGTWCGWCMKGMPAMKEAYAKHRTAVEFVGIDCGDTPQVWKQTLAGQQLPWINVRAADDDLPVRYGIEGFPTKMILDAQGVIVARFTGEDPAFYTMLDSLARTTR